MNISGEKILIPINHRFQIKAISICHPKMDESFEVLSLYQKMFWWNKTRYYEPKKKKNLSKRSLRTTSLLNL